jgi:uncharacterized protein (DUF1778 family)
VQQLLELNKQLYVDTAVLEAQRLGKRTTISNLSTLTGIHRKEIKRLLETLDQPESPEERKASVSAQIVSQWLGSDATTYSDGRPRPLPYHSDEAGTPSFYTLVRGITQDVHPRTLLETLKDVGLLQQREDGLIELTEAGYLPDQNWEEKLFFAGKNLGAHSEAVVRNLLNEQPPRLDRAVYYYRLTHEAADTLEAWAREHALDLLIRFNREAARLQSESLDAPEEATEQVHLGTYFHRDKIG